jgi:uncharacterized membrane protein
VSERLDRIEAEIERQLAVNAELMTRQTIQSNAIESLRLAIQELRLTAKILLQTAQTHQQGLETLTLEYRQHRSDGHGG